MRRIYSNYTDDEFRRIESSAETAGLTVSAFCKAAVIEKVFGKTGNFSADLIRELHKKLASLGHGAVSVVSDLYSNEVWSQLNRSEKNTISKQLAKHIRENPGSFAVNEILPDKVTQYIKL